MNAESGAPSGREGQETAMPNRHAEREDGMDNNVPVDIHGSIFDVRIGGPDGAPAVLLLHGFPENSAMWAGVAPALHAAGLRTVAPDQRGYSPGARPKSRFGYRISGLVSDVKALTDAVRRVFAEATLRSAGHERHDILAERSAVRTHREVVQAEQRKEQS